MPEQLPLKNKADQERFLSGFRKAKDAGELV